MMQAAATDLAHDRIHRVRIDLSASGQLSLSHSVIEELTGPVQLFWAHEILQGDYTPQQLTMQAHNPLLRHKVSERVIYDAAWHKAVELGGFDALFMNVQKNTYLVNGHNYQEGRLPIYLPGNGGILTAVAMMCAGWDGTTENNPGFPKNGQWNVRWEGLEKMF